MMADPSGSIRSARGFAGRAIHGDIVQFDARRRGYDVVITVRQERGPSQHFVLYPDRWTMTGVLGPLAAGLVSIASVLCLLVVVGTIFATSGGTDVYGTPVAGLSLGLAVPLSMTFLVAGAVCARFSIGSGLRRRYQRCPHAAAIQEAVSDAGDPRGQKWAQEAVNALRGNEFCRDSGILHLMADKPDLFEDTTAVASEPEPIDEQVSPVPAPDADTNIASLQALRRYSQRWDQTP